MIVAPHDHDEQAEITGGDQVARVGGLLQVPDGIVAQPAVARMGMYQSALPRLLSEDGSQGGGRRLVPGIGPGSQLLFGRAVHVPAPPRSMSQRSHASHPVTPPR